VNLVRQILDELLELVVGCHLTMPFVAEVLLAS
jgi:hypothetical protein